VVHRDIKPSNVLLDRHGTAWLTDFGLAKHTEQDDVTKTGDIVGTLRYMAPEQFAGEYDGRSDIYSLGITLHELLTGKPAFEEKQHAALMQRITSSGPPRLRQCNSALPSDLEIIVQKATALEPGQRYQTAGEFADDLQRIIDDRPIRARRVSAIERLAWWSRRNPALAVTSGLSFLLLVLVAATATLGNLRTNRALARAEQATDDANRALARAEQATKDALDERNRAAAEHQRAEANVKLAVRAFENIIDKISARGVPLALELDLADEEAALEETALTTADAELLQSLLEFFDEFAKQNGTDLRAQTAEAHWRVGDIRSRLLQFDQAVLAYQEALRIYEELSKGAASAQNVVARARLLNELGSALFKRGDQWDEAKDSYEAAVRLLRQQPPDIADDRQSRFQLVQTYLALASMRRPPAIVSPDPRPIGDTDRPKRDSDERRDRDRGGDGDRDRDRDRDGDRDRDRRSRNDGSERGSDRSEPQSYHELALAELQGLLDEQPGNSDYQFAMARCYRQYGTSWRCESAQEAEDSLRKAIVVLDQLVETHPDVTEYRVELADTLLLSPRQRPSAEPAVDYRARFERARGIAADLVAKFPQAHEYRALLAGSIRKLGSIQQQTGDQQLAEASYREAIGYFETLIDEYPTISLYHFALAQARERLGNLMRHQQRLTESHTELERAVKEFETFAGDRKSKQFVYRRLGELRESLADTIIDQMHFLEATGKTEEARALYEKARQLRRDGRDRRSQDDDRESNGPRRSD
jgi:tetratricopeptide (TPR) repeat protein